MLVRNLNMFHPLLSVKLQPHDPHNVCKLLKNISQSWPFVSDWRTCAHSIFATLLLSARALHARHMYPRQCLCCLVHKHIGMIWASRKCHAQQLILRLRVLQHLNYVDKCTALYSINSVQIHHIDVDVYVCVGWLGYVTQCFVSITSQHRTANAVDSTTYSILYYYIPMHIVYVQCTSYIEYKQWDNIIERSPTRRYSYWLLFVLYSTCLECSHKTHVVRVLCWIHAYIIPMHAGIQFAFSTRVPHAKTPVLVQTTKPIFTCAVCAVAAVAT